MAEFLTLLRAELRGPVVYLAWVVLSLTIAIAGPFGSYVALSLPERLLFWSLCVGLGLLVGVSVRIVVNTWLGVRGFRRGAVVVALICAVLMAWPMRFLAQVMFPVSQSVFSASILDVFLFIFAVSLTVGAVRRTLEVVPLSQLMEPISGNEVTVDMMATLPRIVQRLEPEVQGRLIAMTVRDHYVDVFTTAGRGSVLIRFADAITEAGDEIGDQIHRSHWVAWWAVKGVEREGGKIWLRLCPEMRLPVSKTYRNKLVERGLEAPIVA